MRAETPRACRPRWPTNCFKLLSALETAETLEQLRRFPGWKLHALKGDLKGSWSLTVTGNWRLVFSYDEHTNTASDIDLIDYH
jgi:proteic killer suppression protein